ncbi:MAG: hypothetical protein J0I47_09300 [Sphingomonas sp.]|uniref:hypothetical protein n=1 Tax=Sphingomonas sp. TaxID=28214 RepID=UPI001ACD7F95|nr:hypothetical protein [Sphingomonas sp.]MBN8808415.1 hypothetical protein [Sphingomonas sp.]
MFREGTKVGVYEQSGTQFVAGLDEHTTLIVPLGQDGPNTYSATFVLGEDDDEMCLPGALIREPLN